MGGKPKDELVLPGTTPRKTTESAASGNTAYTMETCVTEETRESVKTNGTLFTAGEDVLDHGFRSITPELMLEEFATAKIPSACRSCLPTRKHIIDAFECCDTCHRTGIRACMSWTVRSILKDIAPKLNVLQEGKRNLKKVCEVAHTGDANDCKNGLGKIMQRSSGREAKPEKG